MAHRNWWYLPLVYFYSCPCQMSLEMSLWEWIRLYVCMDVCNILWSKMPTLNPWLWYNFPSFVVFVWPQTTKSRRRGQATKRQRSSTEDEFDSETSEEEEEKKGKKQTQPSKRTKFVSHSSHWSPLPILCVVIVPSVILTLLISLNQNVCQMPEIYTKIDMSA